MSYGNRGIGHGMHGNSRPGLLGAGPTSNHRRTSLSPQQSAVRRDRGKPGLLGNAPQHYQEDEEMYDRDDSYNDRRESSYENTYEEQPYKREPPGGDRYPPLPPPMPNKDRIPPKTRRIMENFGLTNSDLEELSRLPEHKLSSSNFIEMIKTMKERKNTSQPPSSRRQSFDDHYEPAQQNEKFHSYDSPPRYPEERRQEDAFSSFQEKWYSETSKKNEREQQMSSSSSILRGSRGPMAKSGRWEREERPDEQHLRRSPRVRESPRMRESQQRRMSSSPQRRSSPVMMSSRRMSPPPVRRMSPPPRRASPPPQRRHASPPVRMPKGIAGRGGLLGDPRDPSTQELDMLAAAIPRPHDNYRHHDFPEPSRRNEPPPMRSRTPPPLMAQVVAMKRKEPMPLPRPAPRPDIPRKQAHPPPPSEKMKPNSDMSFPKAHAMSEANIMRRELGRVLYLRYKAGAIGIIRDEHLVKLAQPFEKVTNILLMAPTNLNSGWYQAFIELAHFDGAAAMLEHYMTRPPTIEGVTLMVQRSKHPTLRLRTNQMNRDFDHLLDAKPEPKRRRAMSLSPDRGRKRTMRSRRDSTKEQELPKKKPLVGQPLGRERASQDRKEERKAKVKKERMDSSAEKKSNRSEKDSSTEKKSDRTEKAKEIKEKPVKEASQEKDSKEATLTNGAVTVSSKLKDEKNKERLDIIRDNLDQAITMSEELLPLITEESSKEILSEVMEYLADSASQLKEIEATME